MMFRKIKKYKSATILIVLILLMCMPFSTVQAGNYKEKKITQTEKGVFAFFDAIHSVPDYEFWITSGRTYQAAPENLKEDYLLQETLRLGRGFGQFSENEELLEIKVDVLAKYISPKEDKPPRMTFRFFNQDEAYIPSFEYAYGQDKISLVINQFAIFSDIPLDDVQSEAVLGKIPYEDDDFDATLTIHVKASEQSSSNYTMVKDGRKWLMVGEIAYLKCVYQDYASGGEEFALWDYVAPWYEETMAQKLIPEEEKYPHPYDLFKD